MAKEECKLMIEVNQGLATFASQLEVNYQLWESGGSGAACLDLCHNLLPPSPPAASLPAGLLCPLSGGSTGLPGSTHALCNRIIGAPGGLTGHPASRPEAFLAVSRAEAFLAISRAEASLAVARAEAFLAVSRAEASLAVSRAEAFLAVSRAKAFLAVSRAEASLAVARAEAFLAVSRAEASLAVSRAEAFLAVSRAEASWLFPVLRPPGCFPCYTM
eukprot:jgi/Botrbrau1/2402/Bobra.0395s0031.1